MDWAGFRQALAGAPGCSPGRSRVAEVSVASPAFVVKGLAVSWWPLVKWVRFLVVWMRKLVDVLTHSQNSPRVCICLGAFPEKTPCLAPHSFPGPCLPWGFLLRSGLVGIFSILFSGSLRGWFLLGISGGPNPGQHRSWPELLWTKRTSVINSNIENFSTSVEQRKAQGSNFRLCTQSPIWQPLQWVFWQVISLRESLTFCGCPRQSLIKFWMLLLRHPLLIRLPYFAKRRSLCELKISGYVHSRSCIKQCLGSGKVEEFNQNTAL